MSLRTTKIRRGPHKGEETYAKPRTYNLDDPGDRRRAIKDVIERISFFVGRDIYVCDGRATGRKGPRSKFDQPMGSIYEVWPTVFQRAEIDKIRNAPKGKAAKKRAKAKRKTKRKAA